MIATLVPLSSRLCASASAGQWLMWLMLVSFAAPFAVYVVRMGREDLKKAAILGLAIILVVVVLVGTANAVPILDPCDTCKRLWPSWMCWLGCL